MTCTFLPWLRCLAEQYGRSACTRSVAMSVPSSRCSPLCLALLVHLRTGETVAELGAGSGVSTSTTWRYVPESVALLSARSPKPAAALRTSRACCPGLCSRQTDPIALRCRRITAAR